MALGSFQMIKNHIWTGFSATPSSPNDEFFPLDETWDWSGKLMGSYRAPYEITVSALYNFLAGVPRQRTYMFRNVPNATSVTLPLEELGAQRDPAQHVVNIKALRPIQLGGSRRLSLSLEVFNLFNVNTATTVRYVSSSTYGAISADSPAARRAHRRRVLVLTGEVRYPCRVAEGRMRRPRLLTALFVASLMLPQSAGAQNYRQLGIYPVFDGWETLPDGSMEFYFGYMNRHTTQITIPLGPDNTFEPAPADQNQPTNFLPGRHEHVFTIKKPKGFNGKLIWTLKSGVGVQKAIGVDRSAVHPRSRGRGPRRSTPSRRRSRPATRRGQGRPADRARRRRSRRRRKRNA